MNDTELDNLLNTWTTPDPPPSLRRRARAGYATLKPELNRGFRLSFWTIAFGFAAFLLVLTAALPKTVELVEPTQKIPYIVETDTTSFMRDGTAHEVRMTTYLRDGVEIILARTPGNPLTTPGIRWAMQTFAIKTLNSYSHVFFSVDPHRLEEFVTSGCSKVPIDGIRRAEPLVPHDDAARDDVGTVVGHETILGYQTTVTEHLLPSHDEGDALQDGRIITLWQAPDLGCFDLKMVHEQKNSEGTRRLVEERHALRVTVNR
jgi:hypothetical protein